ncbi:MAG: hypothetical protein LBD20_06545 [Spirochaetaceae bacterium]|jgi:hypothetical protein|nr:hypothetical protein [Spirochaetaceae bacterium]
MKKLNISFICIFLLIITLPFLFMDRKSTISKKENRTLAAFPHIVTSDGRIDSEHISKFPRMADSYINDRFGFRNTFTSLAAAANTTKKINGHVIIGKNDWLFYSRYDDGNNIADFFKLNLFTQTEITRVIESIDRRRRWCEAHGIKFIFLIAPNKHNVYPEYYPFARPEGITRTEQIMAALPAALKDTVIYPLDSLLQNKGGQTPLYFETGTHWNMTGAHLAYKILFDRIQQLFPQTTFPAIDFVTEICYDESDSIAFMSGFSSYGKPTTPVMRPVEGWDKYYHCIKNGGKDGADGIIIENTDIALPRAIIFRDSFFMALEPFVSTLFSYAEYHWRRFSEQEAQDILQNKPDIIIWEVVERSMAGIR